MADLKSQLATLPEAEEPPPTTLQVLGRSHQEQDWQRLLVHFLTPNEAHGLDHAGLEHFLRVLSDRDDLDYTFSPFDLENVRIDQEIVTDEGRPDVVLWSSEDWFICCELKVDSSEGDDQTQRYVDVASFRSIGVEKSDVPTDGHHYVYLAPSDASPPEADEFVHLTWEWVAAELQSFLAESYGEYPARTTAQLSDFTDTIRNELTMTEYQENQQEKVKLYIDHYDEISEVQTAFEERWTELTQSWGTRLAEAVDAAEIVANTDVPEEYVSAVVRMENGTQKRWIFRQSKSDWGCIFPSGWWTKLDERRPICDTPKPNGRVGFLHRLDWHREDALQDQNLIFYLRNAPSGHKEFYDNFANRFNADEDIPELLPSATNRPGVKSNVLEATYDINVEFHDDFFEAYIEALARAIEDHVVSNPELVEKIDSIYEQTIAEDTPF